MKMYKKIRNVENETNKDKNVFEDGAKWSWETTHFGNPVEGPTCVLICTISMKKKWNECCLWNPKKNIEKWNDVIVHTRRAPSVAAWNVKASFHFCWWNRWGVYDASMIWIECKMIWPTNLQKISYGEFHLRQIVAIIVVAVLQVAIKAGVITSLFENRHNG